MKQKLFLLMLVLAAMLSQSYSYPTVDTVWVKNSGLIRDAKFSPDGNLIYCMPDNGDTTRKPFILSAANGDTVKLLDACFGGIPAMDLSKDGSLFIAPNKSGDSVCVIDTKNYNIIKYLLIPASLLKELEWERITSVAVSRDNKYVAACICGSVPDPKTGEPTAKFYIVVWQLESGTVLKTILDYGVENCTFSPRDNILAASQFITENTGSYRIDLYNTDTWAVDNSLCCHGQEIECIRYSGDGKYLASSANNNPCRIWDMDSKSIVVDNDDSGLSNGVHFTNDNNYIYTNYINHQMVYGNISTKQTYSLNNLGMSLVRAISSNNKALICYTGIFLINLNNTNSVDNTSSTEVITVSPNPSNGTADIRFTVAREGKYNIDVIDMNGKIVKSFGSIYCNLTNNMTLDLSGISSGAYFIKIWNDTYSKSYKLVIN